MRLGPELIPPPEEECAPSCTLGMQAFRMNYIGIVVRTSSHSKQMKQPGAAFWSSNMVKQSTRQNSITISHF